MIPSWLHILALASLWLGLACAAVIAADEIRLPQPMWIMNVVWPVAALFASVLVLWIYVRYARLAAHGQREKASKHKPGHPKGAKPFTVAVAESSLHCGAGCCLGDICAEWLAFFVPNVLIWLGWTWIFPEKMFAAWVLDYAFAFAFGIAFQYFTIKPMRGLSPRQGLIAALKADALSLTAWQVGMYGFMAFAQLYAFKRLVGAGAEVDSAEFWFTMQLAMIAGFITSFPVNWWLLTAGIKEQM